MPDVFLSYSREDQVTARRFAQGLQREGFSVWWDEALSIGEAFDKVTEKALDDAKAVVVLWSTKSVDSRWVRAEATQAQSRGRLAPVMIEPCKRPIMFELTQTADLSGWNGDSGDARWESFVSGLKRFVGSGDMASAAGPLPLATRSSRSRRAALAWAGIAVAFAVGLGLFWHFQSRDNSGPVAAADAGTTATASIAVLPFRDMSQSKDQEYFADGVTEEILNSLASLKDLKVTARTSAFAFKGKDVDLRTVGETLGVQNILEGSIRKDGEKLRITAQLIDATTDAHLWSKTYDRPLTDVFAVQDEIARSVAEALQVTLGVGVGGRPGMTRDFEAFDAYLQASELFPRFSADTRRRGVQLLERAVARDPGFALAWFALSEMAASVPSLIGANASSEEGQAWLRKSENAFREFERLMQGTPELHKGLAARSLVAGHLSEAAEHYEAAAAESPSRGSRDVSFDSALLLLMVGRSRQAAVQLDLAKARDPLDPAVATLLIHAYGNVGNFEAAMAEADRAYQLGGSNRTLAAASAITQALGKRDREQIHRWLDAEAASGAPNPVTPDFNTRMKQLLDKPTEALAYLQALTEVPAVSVVTLSAVAVYQAYFGDPQAALRSIRLTHARGLPTVANLMLWHPVMRDVRKLPGFKQLARDFGLVDYWKKFGWAELCEPIPDGDDFQCR